jgi:hypothetical protein
MRADEPAPDFWDEDAPYAPGVSSTGHVVQLTDVEAVVKPKRHIGFVTEDDYVRRGVVIQRKRRRK